VLIKVKMFGIFGTDGRLTCAICFGVFADDSGQEIWGVIEESAPTLKDKTGDRVSVDICMPCGTCYFLSQGEGLIVRLLHNWQPHTDGAFAEY
jgi:threonine dehydrogenase-like Zn-dependent dehydrogenase